MSEEDLHAPQADHGPKQFSTSCSRRVTQPNLSTCTLKLSTEHPPIGILLYSRSLSAGCSFFAHGIALPTTSSPNSPVRTMPTRNHDMFAFADENRSGRHILKVGIPFPITGVQREWVERGGTTTQIISRRHIGGVTEKRDRPGWSDYGFLFAQRPKVAD
jgi:hypothetical protein